MKNRSFFWLSLLILFPFFGRAGDGPLPLVQEEKFIYVDSAGQKSWAKEWDWAWPFRDGRAGVRQGAEWALLNDQGEKVGETKFNWVGLFSEGLAAARLGKKWGYLNRQGRWAIAPFYSDVRPFREGVAAVQVGGLPNVVSKVDQLPGLPELYGKLAKKTDFQVPAALGGKWGLINTKDKYLVEPKYEAVLEASQDLVLFKEKGAWGYLNLKGEVVIAAQYLEASPFCDGLASVTLMNCRTGKIDRQGQWQEKGLLSEDARQW